MFREHSFDVLIQHAKVVDGSGNPWFYGDVALVGDRIAAVTAAGQIAPERAGDIIDAEGMVVCPGFIDIQSHAIAPLMEDGRCLSKISQGVTSEIMGEGWTPAPFGGQRKDPIEFQVYAERLPQWQERARHWGRFSDWFEAMLEHGVSPNIGSFMGGGSLREYVMGYAMRPANAEEIAAQQKLLAQTMDDGAFGVSYALIYPPDTYANSEELIAVCQALRSYRGVYITHLRSEGDDIFPALDEAFQVAAQADIPVEIYHLKAMHSHNWQKMPEVIAKIDQARAQGLDITADMYPYVASGTGLTSVLPAWTAADGKLWDRLADPTLRAEIKAAVQEPDGSWEAMAGRNQPQQVMPIGFQRPEHQQYIGKRLDEIAAMRQQHWIDAACDLLLAEKQRVSTIYFLMDEDNVRLQLRQPWIKISTDAGGFDPAWAKALGPVHPRAYGTFPRVLGKYVREEKIVTLEDAIRKMTSAVADRLGLRERGLLRQGMAADVVIFDPERISDQATFSEPHQLSVGVRDVWVNGMRVLADSQHTGATPGRHLRPWV